MRKKAFSLVELSIVILIIGVLIAAVGQGLDLLQDSRITAARLITKSSRANSVKGMVFWFEPSLEESFIASEAINGTTISQWKDTNPQSDIKLDAKAGQKTDATLITYNVATSGTSGNTSGPTYIEKGLNNLPTLRFTNSDSAFIYLAVDKRMSNIPNKGMNLFLVMTYRSGSSSFIDRVCHDTNFAPTNCGAGSAVNDGNPLFEPYIASDGSLRFYVRDNTNSAEQRAVMDGGACSGFCWDTGYDLKPGVSYILTMQRNYKNTFTLYINGNSTYAGGVPSKTDIGGMITLDPYKIGRHAIRNTGETTDIDISEMIFFTGNMAAKDRNSIEDYLGKKYNIKVTH
ncbi:MAG: prepilin-type N-terminal cleavage/methylation domain-containing protein [Alphaproteobacteria bacterium]|nr:prepilin-type N-terminal cleavage/methylation domain-containing protein [Alphaproteobacteria bacterium]